MPRRTIPRRRPCCRPCQITSPPVQPPHHLASSCHEDIPCARPVPAPLVPAEIMSHGVWLYDRFSLSDHDVEERMVERGVTVSYEAVRYWCRALGQAYANQ